MKYKILLLSVDDCKDKEHVSKLALHQIQIMDFPAEFWERIKTANVIYIMRGTQVCETKNKFRKDFERPCFHISELPDYILDFRKKRKVK